MKKFLTKKTLSLALAAIVCAASSAFMFSGCGEKEDDVDNTSGYVVATKHTASDKIYTVTFEKAFGSKDVMPVGVYAGPHSEQRTYHGKTLPSMVSKEYFDLYQEMGLNFFTSTLSDKDPKINEFLTLCDEYNMGAFVSFEDLVGPDKASYVSVDLVEKNLEKFADDHKSLMGFYLRDEPNKTMIDKLKKTTDALHKSIYRKNMYAYGNAFPEYGLALTGFSSWEEYLRYYCDSLKLGYLSYDYYPWHLTANGDEVYATGYIKGLSTARKVANDYKIPLWSFKQCGSIFESIPMSKQKFLPDENKFRWQMAIDLVYGVKGIQYFLLCGDALGYDGVWEAGIDDYFGIFNAYTGKPNRWFDYAKEFNAHLKNIQSVLMNSAHEGVIVNGKVVEKSNIGDELIESGTYNELTGVSGDASWVGCYNYKGQTVLYVMNNSYKNNGQVTLEFSDNYGYKIYQQTNTTNKTGNTVTLELLPGEGAMVMLKYA